MTLLVTELRSRLEQTVTPDRTTQVVAIRPHIYKHNSPAGTFKIRIKKMNGAVIAESNSLNASDLSTSDFFHGLIRFDISCQLKAGETYRIALIASDYTFSESNYLGWCNSFDLSSYQPAYESNGTFNSPLRFEVWEKRQA